MRYTIAGDLTRNTTPIRLTHATERRQHQIRFVYGRALDASTYPCYFLRPNKADDGGFQLVDASMGYVSSLPYAASLKPLGLEHFYDVFSIDHELDLRVVAQKAFDLPANSINDDLSVTYEVATAILPHIGQAYPVPAEEDDDISVVSVASSGAQPNAEQDDTDSNDAKPSDAEQTTHASDVTIDEDASDEESEDDFELSEADQRYLQEAYEEFSHYANPWLRQMSEGFSDSRAPFADAWYAQEWFDKLIDLPDSWPLMRILVPLEGLSLQAERIIACVAAELVATHQAPYTQSKFAKRLTWSQHWQYSSCISIFATLG